MLKINLLLFLCALVFSSFAQQKSDMTPEFSASETTLVSSGSDLPFWMISNSNGIYALHHSSYLLFQAGMKRALDRDSLKKWGYTYGANLVYGQAGTSNFQMNEYWLGVRFRSLTFKAGAEADPIIYGGLSSTNGNMYHSNNARPVPGLSVSTNGYIPFLFAKKWLTYQFKYEEGILKDKQAVDNAHLHHKNFYLRGVISPTLSLAVGLEHYVFWGGYSPVYGQQPGISEYFRYIIGLKGGAGATISDQINVAGNQLGSYNLEVKKEWKNITATFYWNHPFEDRSGMEFANLPDGLWGIHLGRKDRKALITDFVYEYMGTLNQSGTYHLQPAPTPQNPDRRTGRGMDTYFTHNLYTSGFTHYQRMMGTPLFVPVIGADGISKGFESTRMVMHHLGVGGALGDGFFWKSMLNWSRNFGNYGSGYPNPLDELSGVAECRYVAVKLPVEIKAGVAADYGDRFEHRYGGYLGIGFHF